MNVDVILVTYGEPPQPKFIDQWGYSNRILSKLTKLVAPIPSVAVPFIGAMRGYSRVKLWKESGYFSPLEEITEKQAQGISKELKERMPDVNWRVHTAYEFREPLLQSILRQIQDQSCGCVILVPMYLAVSDFTTGISQRDFGKYQQRTGNKLPDAATIAFRFHLKELAEIMAGHVYSELEKKGLKRENWKQFGLLLGCHGTVMYPPPGITDTGYQDTFDTYELLEQKLSSEFKAMSIGWLNHRLGGEWTSPTLEQAAQKMLDEGIDEFIYFPFGFIGDNAESQLEGKTILQDLGIANYHQLPCVNDRPEFLHFLAKLVVRTVENPPSLDGSSQAA